MEVCVQNFYLSLQAINKILKKHQINEHKNKHWKFFKARYSKGLWQVSLKEFKFEGKSHYSLRFIGYYIRVILTLNLFEHLPKTKEITSTLEKLKIKPQKILADNGQQFKEK